MSTPTINQHCNKNCNRLKEKAFRSNDLSLRLTAVINEVPTPFYDSATISGDGALVWVVRTFLPQPEETPVATLYRNEGGLLVPAGDVEAAEGFTDAAGGAIAESGAFAFLVDESEDAAQVRVFALPSLALLRTIPIPNIDNPNIQLVVAPRVFLNRYASIIYPTNEGTDFVVALVDLLTGTIATAPIQGISSDAGYIFELNGQIYQGVGSSVVNPVTGATTGPSFYDIFAFEANQLIRVTQAILPGIIGGQSIQIRHDTALIALAVGATNLPPIPPVSGAPSTFVNPNREPAGIWLFAFDGCQLCLAALKTTNSGQRGFLSVTFDPTGRFLVATIPSPRTPALATMVTYRLEPGCNCEVERITSVEHCCKQLVLKEVDVNLVAPATISVQFSRNGRWLIVSGGTFGSATAPNFPEVNLFRVFYAPCADFENGLLA